jgi:hypothetical protein
MLPSEFIDEATAGGPGPILFSVLRDEMLRLPSWLAHYRRAGVGRFAIIDNGSTDGSYELLEAQPDVALMRHTGSYAASNFGMHWLNEFHDRIPAGTWVLYADTDELLVYRGWPDRPVAAVASDAAAAGCNAVFGFLLDMYPDGPLEDANIGPGQGMFDVAPCFDAHYHMRQRPLKPWEPSRRAIEVIGGPRVRLLSNLKREASTGWFDYFLRGQIDRLLPLVPARLVPWVVRTMPQQMPSLAKAPLVQSGTGFHYTNGHGGEGARFAPENVVVCHFKFLSDFAARVRREAARGEHYRRGAEYIMYGDILDKHDRIDLRNPDTRRFASPGQLADLGLLRDIRPLLAP